jgi:hypothetical protein
MEILELVAGKVNFARDINVLSKILKWPVLFSGGFMARFHFDSAFKCMPIDDIDKWIEFNHNQLIGSAVFTKNNKIGSKLVRWAESWRCKDKGFMPSHTGSIIEYKDEICLFDMKPIRATIQPLAEYLKFTDDSYSVVMRDFELDTKMFSKNIAYHIGEFYPYMSAIRSVFTKRQTKWVRHCSEMHLRELQKQDLFLDVNPEITPDELYHLLVVGKEK